MDSQRNFGVVQLAAWSRNASTPGLVLEMEESGFKQIAMIEGVYAFELIGGKASRVIVVVFDSGTPRVALRDSALDKVVITSNATRMMVDVRSFEGANQQPVHRHYEFKAGKGETRRYPLP